MCFYYYDIMKLIRIKREVGVTKDQGHRLKGQGRLVNNILVPVYFFDHVLSSDFLKAACRS